MGVYFTYAFFAGFGSDKHNYFNVITFGYGAVLLLIVAKRKIGNNNSINATFNALAAEVFKPKLHDRIQVSHKYKWNFHIFANAVELFEKPFE